MTTIKHFWYRLARSPWDAYLAFAAGILVMVFGDPVLALLLCAIGAGSWLVQRWGEQRRLLPVRARGADRGSSVRRAEDRTMSEIKAYRPDGWPLCPCCEEDELWSALLWDGEGERPEIAAYIAAGLTCYLCGWSNRS